VSTRRGYFHQAGGVVENQTAELSELVPFVWGSIGALCFRDFEDENLFFLSEFSAFSTLLRFVGFGKFISFDNSIFEEFKVETAHS